MKTIGKHANNFVRLAIERDGLSNDGAGAAKFLFPETIRDHCGVGCARRIVLVSEGTPQHGRNPEQGQSAVGHVKSVKAFGFSNARNADSIPVVDADVLKGLILLAIDEVVGGRHVEVGDVDPRSGVPDADQFVGLGVGERLKQDAFENAEDDGVAANASGKGDERDGGEEGCVSQAAEDLLQMAKECAH